MPPSELPMSLETPREACARLVSQAITYVGKKTDAWPPGARPQVMATEEVRLREADLDTAMLANDPDACAAACRAWWTAIFRHGPREEGTI